MFAGIFASCADPWSKLRGGGAGQSLQEVARVIEGSPSRREGGISGDFLERIVSKIALDLMTQLYVLTSALVCANIRYTGEEHIDLASYPGRVEEAWVGGPGARLNRD